MSSDRWIRNERDGEKESLCEWRNLQAYYICMRAHWIRMHHIYKRYYESISVSATQCVPNQIASAHTCVNIIHFRVRVWNSCRKQRYVAARFDFSAVHKVWLFCCVLRIMANLLQFPCLAYRRMESRWRTVVGSSHHTLPPTDYFQSISMVSGIPFDKEHVPLWPWLIGLHTFRQRLLSGSSQFHIYIRFKLSKTKIHVRHIFSVAFLPENKLLQLQRQHFNKHVVEKETIERFCIQKYVIK